MFDWKLDDRGALQGCRRDDCVAAVFTVPIGVAGVARNTTGPTVSHHRASVVRARSSGGAHHTSAGAEDGSSCRHALFAAGSASIARGKYEIVASAIDATTRLGLGTGGEIY